MGGNLFECRRITTEQYNILKDELYNLLTKLFIDSGSTVNFIPFIKEKQDHGDIDIVVGMKHVSSSFISNLVKEHFSNIKITSKNTLSVLYKQVQVDLILVPLNKVSYAVNYFSYNDLGNLIGRMCKPLGFKHGHLGLEYKVMYNTTHLKDITLSNDFNTILNILELDKHIYRQGFNTFKEMFDFVISSPYFDKQLFLFENLNNKNRVRDKKRKTYNMFLDYLETIEKEPKQIKEPTFNFVCRHFPSLYNTVTNIYSDYFKHRETKKTITDYLRNDHGLKEKQLGQVICKIKENKLFILPMDTKTIDNIIKSIKEE